MEQTLETGRVANDFGRNAAFKVARYLVVDLKKGSNECLYNGMDTVIKSARLKNNRIGITNKMLERVSQVIIAKEVSLNIFDLYLAKIDNFIQYGTPTASRGASADKVTNFNISKILGKATKIGQIELN